MVKEKNLFTVTEEEFTEEIIRVAEDEISNDSIIVSSPDEFIEEDKENKDWRVSKKPKHFIIFLVNEVNRIPKPSHIRGNKSMLEKALGMYKQLDSYISKALRSDYDDEIDANKVDEIRGLVNRYENEVQMALDGMMTMERNKKVRRRRADEDQDLVKEAGTPHFTGLQVQMSAFERAIVGALINGSVSGGHNIEELYKVAKDKYNFTEREELALLQLLSDFGYPVFKDRLTFGTNDTDPTRKENNGEWMSNYYA